MGRASVVLVRMDGAVYPVKLRYNHWLPRWLGFAGTSIGLTIFLRQPWGQWLHPELLGHELVHALHFVRIRENTPLRLYWLAVAIDLALYVLDWVRAGFRYREMAEEVRAYGQQAEVAAGTHPDIRILPPGAA